jgi:hypothetical protein
MEKIYMQMSSYTEDVTGIVMSADFNVSSTALDGFSCRYSLYLSVTVRLDGRFRQRSVTHNARLRVAVNKTNTDL